jgi:DNA helicase-2/ATP-dependent DNA helicase PcrA
MEWSQYQKDIFSAIESTEDSLIIEAVAGSGKTTTIVEAINHVPRDKSVVFLAFNKSIADELKRRVTAPNASCKTLHSLGLSAWKRANWEVSNDMEVDGKKVRGIVDEMELGWGEWTQAMSKLVGLAKGGGLVPKGLEGQYHGLAQDTLDNWEEAFDRYDIDPDEVDLDLVRKVLVASIARAKDVIDFDDMLYMPIIAGVEFEKADVVFVDEAQDVNGIQAEIVSRMRHDKTRVVVVGDPNQSIYGFRGAMHDSMELLQERFNCHRLPLSVSYRCPKAVVKEARRWVSHILHHDAAPDGLVECAQDWLVNSFQPGDAILCRNSAPVIAIAFLLIRNKIAAKVVGRDIGQGLVKLVEKMKARGIADLDDRLKLYREREVKRAKGNASKIASLDDKLATIRVFMDEAGPHAGVGTLIQNINSLFGESQDMRGMVTCSTVHKSKGLEFERVFILDADLYMPSKWARQAWERQQESNLSYVAATRAKRELRYISSEGLRFAKEKDDAASVDGQVEDGSVPAVQSAPVAGVSRSGDGNNGEA